MVVRGTTDEWLQPVFVSIHNMQENTEIPAPPASTSPDEILKVLDPEASMHVENAPDKSASPPSDPDAPYNWPRWKKNAQIMMVAFHSMISTFMAAGIVPAYDIMAEEYGITVTEASYLTSIQVGLFNQSSHIPK